MEKREIIVVGAGPSGSAAASGLAQRGRDVLLLDRQRFPRDKACGDAIPAGAIERLFQLGLRPVIQKADFHRIERVSLISPGGYSVETNLESGENGACSYIVPRLKFDALLQEFALQSGADFKIAQVTAPIQENGRVVGVRTRIQGRVSEMRAKVVIGADGATSILGQSLQPHRFEPQHRAVALRVYLEGLEVHPNLLEFYLERHILPGYAWVFPLGENRANVGLGMRLDLFKRDATPLPDLLENFLALPYIRERLRPGWQMRDLAVWPLNLGSQKNVRNAFNGLLLIGDAAGHINPLTGGGIYNGLVSAAHAVEVVDEAIRQGDVSLQVLGEYERRCARSMRASMRRSYFLQRGVVSFPFAIDRILRLAGASSDLVRIIQEIF